VRIPAKPGQHFRPMAGHRSGPRRSTWRDTENCIVMESEIRFNDRDFSCSSFAVYGFVSTHGISLESQSLTFMYQTIEDGVSPCRIGQECVPLINR
jgi:hypothetical protein